MDGMNHKNKRKGKEEMDNMPYSKEVAVEVKSLDIKFCMCFSLDKGIQLVTFVALVDFLYTLGNMFFGMLFYVVGKSK